MRYSLVIALALAFCSARAQGAPPPDPRSSAAAHDAISASTGLALQGRGAEAVRTLRAVGADEFSGTDAAYRDCVLKRFGGASRSNETDSQGGDAWVARVLAAYRNYWWSSLHEPSARDQQAIRLLAELNTALGTPAKDFDELEPRLKEALLQRQVHALQGQTGVLRELMLWKEETVKTYHVSLPDGPYDTKVHLLNDFTSLGWGDYATCGRRGTGGWAADNALYAVVPRYPSIESEEFTVTFLGHETQHFADQNRFHDLKPWELEYRAKLTELALARQTRDQVLTKFIEDQGDDEASPHSYANQKVLTAMRARLGVGQDSQLRAVPISRFQTAARDSLVEDSKRRAGPSTSPAPAQRE